MTKRRALMLTVILLFSGVGGFLVWRPSPDPPISGVVRATEVRLAPEVGGQLATIKVRTVDESTWCSASITSATVSGAAADARAVVDVIRRDSSELNTSDGRLDGIPASRHWSTCSIKPCPA